MQHTTSLLDLNPEKSYVTIGSFDGVHLGHQKIIKLITAEAQSDGASAVVLTFHPHPVMILRGHRDGFYLTTPDQRAGLLCGEGIDHVVTYPFTPEVSQYPPEQLINELLEHLNMQKLWVGYDFAFGKDRKGDFPYLLQLGKEKGFDVHLVQPVYEAGEVVSSSLIRALLKNGRVDKAALLLGRPYLINGEVVSGDQRGRRIGIRTINLNIWPGRVIPRKGVYAARVFDNGRVWQTVVNIGVRPTFETKEIKPRLEAHLLDFEGDLYGKDVQLEFIARLRDERRFEGSEDLVAQINLDITQAREILSQ